MLSQLGNFLYPLKQRLFVTKASDVQWDDEILQN